MIIIGPITLLFLLFFLCKPFRRLVEIALGVLILLCVFGGIGKAHAGDCGDTDSSGNTINCDNLSPAQALSRSAANDKWLNDQIVATASNDAPGSWPSVQVNRPSVANSRYASTATREDRGGRYRAEMH